MPIDVSAFHGRTLVLDGLAQSDLDMNHFRLINLDTSNLPPLGIPPTIHPPANQWLHDWDVATQSWTATRPSFVHIAGVLTTGIGGQQRAITELGTISVGTWLGNVIDPSRCARINEICGVRPPTGAVAMANQKITGLADPTQPQDAVNKRFMDFLIQGLNPKEAVRVATTSIVSFIGQPVIDGVQTAVGDRVLVKDMPALRQYENGIWVISASGHWPRADDANNAEELNRAFCHVREGNVNGDTAWVQVFPITEPISSEDLTHFILFSEGGGTGGEPGPPGPGVPAGGPEDYILAKKSPADYDTEWVPPPAGTGTPEYAIMQTGILSPAGIPFNPIRPEGSMAGLAGYFTPTTTGKVIVEIAGFMYNTSSAGAITTRMVIGGGTAPVNNAPQPLATSVQIGNIAGLSAIGASRGAPFSVRAATSTLTAGTQFWFDLIVQPVTAGVATLGGVAISAHEIP